MIGTQPRSRGREGGQPAADGHPKDLANTGGSLLDLSTVTSGLNDHGHWLGGWERATDDEEAQKEAAHGEQETENKKSGNLHLWALQSDQPMPSSACKMPSPGSASPGNTRIGPADPSGRRFCSGRLMTPNPC
ncbi:hypothetical protein BP6252_12026 [Coleophoma cylindrospora]|uniref:Uncharacterized protein n=1 Tax=Coleophoma cylindrospora TaxID=1849047 RepID=A0A3D8QFM9_9HELO|nr:hypothetical protein BP6252_12026 [Coleophoma cylindrospora]